MNRTCVIKLVALLLLLSASAALAAEKRVSILYLHRSVGKSIVEDCLDPRFGPRNIRTVLDTLTVASGDTQARFVFRSGNLNAAEGPPVSETTFTGNCTEQQIESIYGGNSTKIWYNNSCPLLELFSDESKAIANQSGTYGRYAWHMFRSHRLRSSASDPGDTVSEKYDLVIIKQPYIIWAGMTSERATMIKTWYREIRDSVKNHPEINFVAAFGTPLCYEEPGGMDFNRDTSTAKLVYQLATWFRDSLDVPNVPNFWAFDCYTSLCETQRVQNRYCLRTDYWAGPTAQSHLNAIGAALAQDALIELIKTASAQILGATSEAVTRQDIDLKIKAFREGTVSMQEVIDLINRYNNGQ